MKIFQNIIPPLFLFYSFTALPIGDDELLRDENGGAFPQSNNIGRNGITNTTMRWPNATVYYEIVAQYEPEEMAMIQQAMDTIEYWTCIRFLPHKNEPNYIVINETDVGSCSSKVGMIGGPQTVNLNFPECFVAVGVAIHELLHALGVIHEHSRPDRDLYIKINTENLPDPDSGETFDDGNFGIEREVDTDPYGAPYDFNSVMHYSSYASTRNGNKTIEPRFDNHYPLEDVKIGQRRGLSVRDVIKIMNMYNCYYNINHTEVSSRVLPNANETSGSQVKLWDTFFRNSKPIRNP